MLILELIIQIQSSDLTFLNGSFFSLSFFSVFWDLGCGEGQGYTKIYYVIYVCLRFLVPIPMGMDFVWFNNRKTLTHLHWIFIITSTVQIPYPIYCSFIHHRKKMNSWKSIVNICGQFYSQNSMNSMIQKFECNKNCRFWIASGLLLQFQYISCSSLCVWIRKAIQYYDLFGYLRFSRHFRQISISRVPNEDMFLTEVQYWS